MAGSLLEAVGSGYRLSGVMLLGGEAAWGLMCGWSGVKKLGSVK